ncbi:MAG: helix-turn-helix domain-containing protein [Phycisphaerales bacterium]
MVTQRAWLESAWRNDTAHRTLGPPRRAQRWVCGFVLKPTGGGYADRIVSDYIIVYVLRGSGRFADASGHWHKVAAGDLLQHAPRQRYSLLPDADGRWAEVYIAADGSFDRVLRATDYRAVDHPVLHPGLESQLVERFEQVHHALRSADDATLECLPAWLLETVLIARGLEHRGGADPHARWVQQACRLLGGDLEHRRNLPGVAEELGVGYERFRKLFVERMGLSPREYRIRRRIDRARELIQQDGLSNKAVAYALGYADPFVFSKQFKQVVGISPAEFRKKMR